MSEQSWRHMIDGKKQASFNEQIEVCSWERVLPAVISPCSHNLNLTFTSSLEEVTPPELWTTKGLHAVTSWQMMWTLQSGPEELETLLPSTLKAESSRKTSSLHCMSSASSMNFCSTSDWRAQILIPFARNSVMLWCSTTTKELRPHQCGLALLWWPHAPLRTQP